MMVKILICRYVLIQFYLLFKAIITCEWLGSEIKVASSTTS